MKSYKQLLLETKLDTNELLWELFQDKEAPTLSDMSKFASDNNLGTNDLYEILINILHSFVGAGMSSKEKVDIDEDQLKLGTKIEYEHTTNEMIARKIALDHLTEIPDYYTRLVKMEEEAEGE